jgi:hypothetical protein
MKRWANEEGAASRNHHGAGGARTGTGMGMGVAAGAAVTGHRPRGSAVGAGKPAKKPINATGTTATAVPVRKTASALSVVADRRGRFGT